jgi:DNA-binding NarL/FixJ family response regulator
METYRIVLATQAHLLHGMLKQVLEKAPGLEVVGETEQTDEIIDLVEKIHPNWVIVSLPPNDEIPQSLIELLTKEPMMAVMAISDDATRFKVKWPDQPEAIFAGVSLETMISILNEQTILKT